MPPYVNGLRFPEITLRIQRQTENFSVIELISGLKAMWLLLLGANLSALKLRVLVSVPLHGENIRTENDKTVERTKRRDMADSANCCWIQNIERGLLSVICSLFIRDNSSGRN